MASRKNLYDLDDLEYETQFSNNKRRKHFNVDEDEEYGAIRYPELETFFLEGLITEVLYTVKSGKEATVYCCKAASSLGVELVAAKVYRSANNRNFKNDTVYQEGRVILNGHTKRAVAKKTEFGRKAHAGMWVMHEYEHLKALYKMKAATPRPYRMAESAILLDFVGDYEQAAPILNRVTLDENEARPLFGFMLKQVELWLKNNLIHADLSPFNILYQDGKLTVIDFPQAVDPRFNPNALALLERDLDNLCRYWARYGIEANAAKIAKSLWVRFQNAQL
jgi:RIO kinase 1